MNAAAPQPLAPPARDDLALERTLNLVHAAVQAGRDEGLRTGYVQGWRWGMVCGISTVACLAGLGLAALSGLGWL